jgi:hypothetical protein
VDVDLERRLVADNEDGVAERLELAHLGTPVESPTGDDEVGAVAVAAVRVVGALAVRWRVVRDLGLGAVLTPQPGDHPRQDHHQAVGARVDDAGLAQDVELLRGALNRPLTVANRLLQQRRQHRILLLGRRVVVEADPLHVGEAPGDRVGHLAEDGQHRPLGGLANRLVGGIGGTGHRGRDQGGVDQLAGAARQLLGGSADDLAQDHAGVAARSHQRRPGERVDELGAADLVYQLAVEAIELLAHRAQGQGHVVAGVAVGDGKDVEVVHLLAPSLELGGRGADHAAKSLDRWVGHLGEAEFMRAQQIAAKLRPPHTSRGCKQPLRRWSGLVAARSPL